MAIQTCGRPLGTVFGRQCRVSGESGERGSLLALAPGVGHTTTERFHLGLVPNASPTPAHAHAHMPARMAANTFEWGESDLDQMLMG